MGPTSGCHVPGEGHTDCQCCCFGVRPPVDNNNFATMITAITSLTDDPLLLDIHRSSVLRAVQIRRLHRPTSVLSPIVLLCLSAVRALCTSDPFQFPS